MIPRTRTLVAIAGIAVLGITGVAMTPPEDFPNAGEALKDMRAMYMGMLEEQQEQHEAHVDQLERRAIAAESDLDIARGRIQTLEARAAAGTGVNLIHDPDLDPELGSFIMECCGSMAPALQTGDRVLVHETSAANLGDIAVYGTTGCPMHEGKNHYLTHRVVEVNEAGDRLRFKGDNNDLDDGCWVDREAVAAVVVAVFREP